jgi:hypothetical protein
MHDKRQIMLRRTLILGGLVLLIAGCSRQWEVAYEEGISPEVTRDWNVTNVTIAVPDTLTYSNSNSYAPNADIVWHGEPLGNRAAQVARIMDEGITAGAAVLNGARPVTLAVELRHFHAVTPAAVANAPGAVHNIRYVIMARDSQTGARLTEPELVSADLEAFVGASAVTAALEGETQRKRIVDHLARVTQGWLGAGPDQRRTFNSVGR